MDFGPFTPDGREEGGREQRRHDEKDDRRGRENPLVWAERWTRVGLGKDRGGPEANETQQRAQNRPSPRLARPAPASDAASHGICHKSILPYRVPHESYI